MRTNFAPPRQRLNRSEQTPMDGMPPPGTDVCALADLANGGAIVVALGRGPARTEVIVVRDDDGVRGFLNVCPHNPLPLNIDSRIYAHAHHVHCDHHFAMFRFRDGLCTAGVCAGQALTPIALVRNGDRFVIAAQA